jgi:hypothetical protein
LRGLQSVARRLGQAAHRIMRQIRPSAGSVQGGPQISSNKLGLWCLRDNSFFINP